MSEKATSTDDTRTNEELPTTDRRIGRSVVKDQPTTPYGKVTAHQLIRGWVTKIITILQESPFYPKRPDLHEQIANLGDFSILKEIARAEMMMNRPTEDAVAYLFEQFRVTPGVDIKKEDVLKITKLFRGTMVIFKEVVFLNSKQQ